MESLYLLIPLSAALVLFIIAVFAWAVQGGQFDDLDSVAERILAADTPPVHAGIDADQGAQQPRTEQSS
jgi:cbb3-type cytochrome oxidase maturation protein